MHVPINTTSPFNGVPVLSNFNSFSGPSKHKVCSLSCLVLSKIISELHVVTTLHSVLRTVNICYLLAWSSI